MKASKYIISQVMDLHDFKFHGLTFSLLYCNTDLLVYVSYIHNVRYYIFFSANLVDMTIFEEVHPILLPLRPIGIKLFLNHISKLLKF